jgi:predicted enzyme related to lactoylglutathione lyase
VTAGIRTVIYPVKDLDAAKAAFTAVIGAAPDVDSPYYVGWAVDGQDIGLDPNGHAQGLTGPVPYFHVADLEAALAALLESGAAQLQPVREVGGGRRIASVTTTEGNQVGLLQDGQLQDGQLQDGH